MQNVRLPGLTTVDESRSGKVEEMEVVVVAVSASFFTNSTETPRDSKAFLAAALLASFFLAPVPVAVRDPTVT